jgi:hypothetical protein
MNGWVLLTIGLISLGVVTVAFAYVGYVLYRLAKAGVHIVRDYGPPTAELAAKAYTSEKLLGQAGLQAEELAATLAHLQVTLRRLQVVADAVQTALSPYQRLRTYFGR